MHTLKRRQKGGSTIETVVMKADWWETSLFLVSWLVALPDPLWKASFPLVRAVSLYPLFLLEQERVLSILVGCLDKNQLER